MVSLSRLKLGRQEKGERKNTCDDMELQCHLAARDLDRRWNLDLEGALRQELLLFAFGLLDLFLTHSIPSISNSSHARKMPSPDLGSHPFPERPEQE